MYEGALRDLPQMRDVYLPGFQRAVHSYAALKRQTGDTEAAAALEARLNAQPPAAPRPDRTRSSRIAGDLRLLEPTVSPLLEADVQRITTALAVSGARAWMLAHHGPSERPKGASEWFVEAYLTPEVGTPAARQGKVVFVVRREQRPHQALQHAGRSRRWRRSGSSWHSPEAIPRRSSDQGPTSPE